MSTPQQPPLSRREARLAAQHTPEGNPERLVEPGSDVHSSVTQGVGGHAAGPHAIDPLASAPFGSAPLASAPFGSAPTAPASAD